LLMVLIL